MAHSFYWPKKVCGLIISENYLQIYFLISASICFVQISYISVSYVLNRLLPETSSANHEAKSGIENFFL